MWSRSIEVVPNGRNITLVMSTPRIGAVALLSRNSGFLESGNGRALAGAYPVFFCLGISVVGALSLTRADLLTMLVALVSAERLVEFWSHDHFSYLLEADEASSSGLATSSIPPVKTSTLEGSA